jgi:hypothetical protein
LDVNPKFLRNEETIRAVKQQETSKWNVYQLHSIRKKAKEKKRSSNNLFRYE